MYYSQQFARPHCSPTGRTVMNHCKAQTTLLSADPDTSILLGGAHQGMPESYPKIQVSVPILARLDP